MESDRMNCTIHSIRASSAIANRIWTFRKWISRNNYHMTFQSKVKKKRSLPFQIELIRWWSHSAQCASSSSSSSWTSPVNVRTFDSFQIKWVTNKHILKQQNNQCLAWSNHKAISKNGIENQLRKKNRKLHNNTKHDKADTI